MLTVMCPNCRHRFPASSGCCSPQAMEEDNNDAFIHPTTCYYGGLLVPKGYTSGGGCFINAPTIIHSQPIINSFNNYPPSITSDLEKGRTDKRKDYSQERNGFKDTQFFTYPLNENEIQNDRKTSGGCQITTSCDLTGGSVTITTPSIQSGGCLIQSTDTGGIVMQTPRMEIRPKLSGGGCLLQKSLSTDNQEITPPILLADRNTRFQCVVGKEGNPSLIPPSGCQELPGIRRDDTPLQKNGEKAFLENKDSTQNRNFNCCCNNNNNDNNVQNGYRGNVDNFVPSDNRNSTILLDTNPGVQIHVNATVQLPASLGQCTVNITATAANPASNCSSIGPTTARTKNNFNGGGLVQKNEANTSEEESLADERRDRSPTTPVSWLMPCPWSFNGYVMDRDAARLGEVKRLLQTCGWYHEGLSWQQSESLLKNAAVGRWLMRDSSDSRYMFAVSVQTARGPTSVRVHYFMGQFRLDAEPRLAFAIPLFDCPIKMLEYYVEYSKCVDEHRKEVWVDYSGQLYSEIYLTKPLVKGVMSLSHSARLVVNRYKLPTENLPPLIRNYIADYPYTL